MANFKIVKHKGKYHVIGSEGVKKPKNGKPTYKEQCFSSHWFLSNAERKKSAYENSNVTLSNKTEKGQLYKIWQDRKIEIIVAIFFGGVFGLMFELAKILTTH